MSLVVRNVTCARSGRDLFSPVSMTLAPGEAMLLRGANGAGKTTLLRALAGLMPCKGLATFENLPVSQAEGRIAYAGHQDAVKPSLTVTENLSLWAGIGGGELDPGLQKFNLGQLADRPAGRLSAGQKRRLGLARLVLGRAGLWLLDEPTTSLDHDNAALVAGLVSDHLARGGIAVVATHTPFDIGAETLTLSAPAQAADTDPFLEGALE